MLRKEKEKKRLHLLALIQRESGHANIYSFVHFIGVVGPTMTI